MENKLKFEAGIAALNFHCDWGVYDMNSNWEICRCTDPVRAEMITQSIKYFLPKRTGKAWLKENEVSIEDVIEWPLPIGYSEDRSRCRYTVYPVDKESSMCYCWTPEGTRLVIDALNEFVNSKKGKKWIKENVSSRQYSNRQR